MSSFFALSSSQITYCGLKDEEGITTQEVSIKVHIPDEALERFNATMYASLAYIELNKLNCSSFDLFSEMSEVDNCSAIHSIAC